MSKYLITVTWQPAVMWLTATIVIDKHPADWLADRKADRSPDYSIVFAILITDHQYEKLAELGYK